MERSLEDVHHYHVKFATKTIGPSRLPDFQYMCSSVHFDHIVYAAIVSSNCTENAVRKINAAWVDAQIHKIVQGRDSFGHDDHQFVAVHLGAMAAHRPSGIVQRIGHHFFGK